MSRKRAPRPIHAASTFEYLDEVGTWEPQPPLTSGVRIYPTEVAPGILVFEWPPLPEEAPAPEEEVQ